MEASSRHYELSKRSIQTGSRSFRLASLFLNSESQYGAYLLYRWCRHCDDEIDEGNSSQEPTERLHQIWEKTKEGLESSNPADESPFGGLRALHTEFGIPKATFFELLKGFQWDVENTTVETKDDLSQYCYYVAGAVGIMMSSILRASEPKALRHADLLGRAMQLTNICRDVAADHSISRIYLPRVWLIRDGLTAENFLTPPFKEKTFQRVLELLEWADTCYEEGRKGLIYLPLRAGWSISVASTLYQSIGWKIRAKGIQSLERRTILNPLEKTVAVVRGTLLFLKIKISFELLRLPKGS